MHPLDVHGFLVEVKGRDQVVDAVEGVVDRIADALVLRRVPDHHARQGTDLHVLFLPARSLHPAVLPLHVEVLVLLRRTGVVEVRLPVPRVKAVPRRLFPVVRVPRVVDEFLNLVDSARIDVVDFIQVEVENRASRIAVALHVVDAHRRKVAVGEVVLEPPPYVQSR